MSSLNSGLCRFFQTGYPALPSLLSTTTLLLEASAHQIRCSFKQPWKATWSLPQATSGGHAHLLGIPDIWGEDDPTVHVQGSTSASSLSSIPGSPLCTPISAMDFPPPHPSHLMPPALPQLSCCLDYYNGLLMGLLDSSLCPLSPLPHCQGVNLTKSPPIFSFTSPRGFSGEAARRGLAQQPPRPAPAYSSRTASQHGLAQCTHARLPQAPHLVHTLVS